MKSSVVTDSIALVGMIAISGLMFGQVPGMVDEIKSILSSENLRMQSVEVANLITLASASSIDTEITHTFPSRVPFTITVNNGYVSVEAGGSSKSSEFLSAQETGPSCPNDAVLSNDGQTCSLTIEDKGLCPKQLSDRKCGADNFCECKGELACEFGSLDSKSGKCKLQFIPGIDYQPPVKKISITKHAITKVE